MPFKSEKQRKYLYAKHPEVAAEYESKTPRGKKLPKYAKSSKKPAKAVGNKRK